MRKFTFQINKLYHVCNRGAGKQEVFFGANDYFRFIESSYEFNSIEPSISLRQKRQNRNSSKINRIILNRNQVPVKDRLCELVCYNILPNHYHYILREKTEGGISSFIKRVVGGYSNYAKHTHDFSGAMFQGPFKAVEINSDMYLHYLIAYVLKNAEIHKINLIKSGSRNKKILHWPWSNILELDNENSVLHKMILEDFKDIAEFKKYMSTVQKNASKIKEDKKIYTLE